MKKPSVHRLQHLLVVIVAALLASGCSDREPMAPEVRAANLQGCENLNVPAGSVLTSRLYARGVQVYRWNGTAWSFVEPSAVLFANARGQGAVGTHFAGPTWASVSGSKVVGSVLDRCTQDAGAIPWLLLGAVSTDGAGLFQSTKFIQRVNTVGGNAPATPGSAVGEIASVPYTADYYFYRMP